MDPPSKRAKTLDSVSGMDETVDPGQGVNNGSTKKRSNTGGGSGSSSRGKKTVVVENPG